MKTGIIICSMLCFPVFVAAQYLTVDSSKKNVEVHGDFKGAIIHLPVSKKYPEYKGGKKEWQNFLRSNINIKVPFARGAKPGIYKVIIRFIVDADGKLQSIGADSNCGYGMEEEVMRCVKKSEHWQPAETALGSKINSSIKTIVIFEVQNNNVLIRFN